MKTLLCSLRRSMHGICSLFRVLKQILRFLYMYAKVFSLFTAFWCSCDVSCHKLGIHFSHFCTGAVCNCLLPESLKISPVGPDPNSQPEDSEKRRLRNPLSCFSSISSQRQLPPSSSFPPSPVKELLPSCSSKKASTASLRNR